jgi:hypothetical protein
MVDLGNGEWVGRVINYTSLGTPFLNNMFITACVDAGVFVGVVRVTAIGVPSMPMTALAKPPASVIPRGVRRAREPPLDDLGDARPQIALVVFRSAAPHEVVFASTTGCAHSSLETRNVMGKSLRAALGDQPAGRLLDALTHARAQGTDTATIGFELGARLVCNATLVGDNYVVARILPAKQGLTSRAADRAVGELPAQRQRLCA